MGYGRGDSLQPWWLCIGQFATDRPSSTHSFTDVIIDSGVIDTWLRLTKPSRLWVIISIGDVDHMLICIDDRIVILTKFTAFYLYVVWAHMHLGGMILGGCGM